MYHLITLVLGYQNEWKKTSHIDTTISKTYTDVSKYLWPSHFNCLLWPINQTCSDDDDDDGDDDDDDDDCTLFRTRIRLISCYDLFMIAKLIFKS